MKEEELETSKKSLAAATICALNYFHKALVTRKSFLDTHADADFYIVIVDRKDEKAVYAFPDVQVQWVEDLGIPDFYRYAFQYDIIELSTSIKPTVLLKLLMKYEHVLYIDPDIVFYRRLSTVFDALQSSPIVVTPHSLSPVLDGKSPADTEFLRFGVFNLGFIGLRRCDEAINFLNWWSDRCLALGFYEPQMGLAVDQGWVTLAPCYFPGLRILRDPGLNMAFWNLHERILSRDGEGQWLVNDASPLYFFHFSSFTQNVPHAIAGKQSRFISGSRPDLHELLDDYAARILENAEFGFENRAYSFNYFEDRKVISAAMRRFYYAKRMKFGKGEDPFCVSSTAYRFASSNRLFGKVDSFSIRLNFKDIGSFSRPITIINWLLKQALRLFGPEKYFNLMRYLAHISSIRNQTDVLR